MRGEHSYSDPPPGAVTCVRCGRLSMGLTRLEAEAAVERANAQLRPGERPLGIEYFRCCARPRFRPARLGDCPDGCTYSAVLSEGFMQP